MPLAVCTTTLAVGVTAAVGETDYGTARQNATMASNWSTRFHAAASSPIILAARAHDVKHLPTLVEEFQIARPDKGFWIHWL